MITPEQPNYNEQIEALMEQTTELESKEPLTTRDQQRLDDMYRRLGQLVTLERFDQQVLNPAINKDFNQLRLVEQETNGSSSNA